jgi:hypothetical protein
MTNENNYPVPQDSRILLYQSDDGKVRLDVRFEGETVWLSQKLLAELFQVSVPTINEHIKTIYKDNELSPDSTIRKFLIVQSEGKREVSRLVDFYNLEMILAIGYRVRSQRGVQFRRWATEQLKEYMLKGFVMDDERLKNPPVAGSAIPDYFDEMLARIRDIRASERRMYLRVKEIFAMAGDYDPTWSETTKFFSVIQNKLHFAATGMTAAELIKKRANHLLPNMGLTSWKGAEVMKTDVATAKNYLNEDEIEELNRIVTMWLDFAEDQAKRRRQVFMKDWERKLDEFLSFNDRRVLANAGKISKSVAESHARDEYELFADQRRKEKERIGEIESIKSLEDAAVFLTKKKTKKISAPEKKKVKKNDR